MKRPEHDPLFAHVFHGVLGLGCRALGGRFGRVPDPATVNPVEGVTELDGLRMAWLHWPGPPPRNGPAPRLVLLHGLNANSWIWARTASLLADRFTVHALDLRGHGRTTFRNPPGTPRFGLDETTADLAAFLDAVAPDEPVVLAGHSWGGKVGIHFAATHPGRVRSLILADPVPPGGQNVVLRLFPGLVRAAFRPERGPFPSRAVAGEMARRLVYLRAGDALDRRFWEQCFTEGPDGTWQPVLPQAAFDEILWRTLAVDLEPRLAEVRCPVRLLKPTFAVSFLPGDLRPMRRAWGSRFTVRVLSGDHTFIHSNPYDTAAAMADAAR
jgi:pimeloyl-ACP methyl ester carboxylesterase